MFFDENAKNWLSEARVANATKTVSDRVLVAEITLTRAVIADHVSSNLLLSFNTLITAAVLAIMLLSQF